jgi:hypothetical protein
MFGLPFSKSPGPSSVSYAGAQECFQAWQQSVQDKPGFRSFMLSKEDKDVRFQELCSWLQIPHLIRCLNQGAGSRYLETLTLSFPNLGDESRKEQLEIHEFFDSFNRHKSPTAFLCEKIESCVQYRSRSLPGQGSFINSGMDWIRASVSPEVFSEEIFRMPPANAIPEVQRYLPSRTLRYVAGSPTVQCVEREMHVKDLTQIQFEAMPTLGEGGEGIVKRSPDGSAYKIWRQEQTSSSGVNVAAKAAAPEYEERLKRLPIWVDDQLALPTAFLRLSNNPGSIAGFEMPLLEDSFSLNTLRSMTWQKHNGVLRSDVVIPFVALYDLLWELEQMGVIVSDLKFPNVLVLEDGAVCLLDADSLGVDGKQGTAYTRGYLDPLLCDPQKSQESPIKPMNADGVWYSYMVMLCEALTGAHPFEAGRHEPADGGVEVPDHERTMKGLSIFHSEVKIPQRVKDALSGLPSDLLNAFWDMFAHGTRGRPNRSLITQLVPSSDSASKPYSPTSRSPWQLLSPNTGDQACMLTGEVEIASIRGSQTMPLMCKVVDGKMAHISGRDVQRTARRILAYGQGCPLKPLDISSNVGIYQDLDPVMAQKLGPQAMRIWVDNGKTVSTARAGMSPFGKPNVGAQRDRAVWIPPGFGRVVVSHVNNPQIVQLSGDLSLFSGEHFSLIFSTEANELLNIFLVTDTVKRISGLPPILGTISNIECVFSDRHAWVFITAAPESSSFRYILTFDADGKLRGLGAVPDGTGAWHSPDVIRAAYDIGKSQKPGLAAIVNNELVRLTCENYQIVPYSRERITGNSSPRILLAREKDAFGVW